jgi:transcriptional regulator with XRE-family HTH domain
MEIGRVIKRLREEKGVSQEELAHRVGMSTPNLWRVESGKHGVRPELLRRLAEEFGVRVVDLYAMSEGLLPEQLSNSVGTVLAKDEALLIEAYRMMPKDRQKLLSATAEFFAGRR